MSGSYTGEGEKLPLLVLTCQGESHPFHERTVALSEVIKVGRSVARAKPTDTNAIFDCKVLSRSHALIWYKNGRFWLRDTNSSNGTFVNNTRVVKHPGEEYADREIFSGDVIRFGVDVTENGTIHGCIIARVTLFHPNGAEAKLCTEPVGSAMAIETLHTEQVFRLAHSVGEALFREQLLENKLSSLSRLLQETQEMAETGWQAILNEERLLHTLDLYESQLSVLKQNLSSDSLESRICQVLEEKVNLEKASEMMINRLVKEKMETLSKVTTLECCLSDLERECSGLRQDYATASEAYQSVTRDYGTKCSEITQLEKQVKDIQTEKDRLGALLIERTHEIELLLKKLEFVVSRTKDSKSLYEPSDGKTDADLNRLLNGLNNGPVENPECNPDHLPDPEAGLDKNPEWTHDGLINQLTDCIEQLHESMELSYSLQEEVALLSCPSLPDPHDSQAANADAGLSQSDQVSSFTDSTESETKKHSYSTALCRIRSQVACVTASQARAEASLGKCLSLQRYLRNLRSVCNTSGDVRAPAPNSTESPDHQIVKQDAVTVSVAPLVSTVPQSSPTDRTQKLSPDSKPISLHDNNDAASPIDEMDIDRLREAFRHVQQEAEESRKMAETYLLQDAAKAELLLTVREECDALRKRIAHIEADVTTSREDHQRLVTEARRTRSEADELRQQRDALNAQVTACTHRIEQLQAALTRNTSLTNTSTSSPVHTVVDGTSDGDDLSQPSTSAVDSVRSPLLNMIAPSFRSPTGTISLFVVVPIMVLLLALIVYVHSKFVR